MNSEEVQLIDPAKKEQSKRGPKPRIEVEKTEVTITTVDPSIEDRIKHTIEKVKEVQIVKKSSGKYRILEDKLFTWGGLPTHLTRGGIITENGYGKEGIERMKAWGVKMEEIEE